MSLLNSVLRASVLRLRDLTFTTPIQVLTRVIAPNGAGGLAENWTVSATVNGRLRHARPVDYLSLRGGEELPMGTWIVMLPTETAVEPSQRLRMAGRTFSILGTDAGRSDALVLTLHCMPIPEAP